MASITRNAYKLSRSVLSIARKVPQTSRYFSSNKNIVAASWKTFDRTLVNTRHCIVNLQMSRNSHTDGDKDLLTFLNEEIAYEKENMKKIPRIRNFDMSMDGSLITLQRSFKDETIEVVFDINENVNVDDAESMEAEAEEKEEMPDIVSYPNFTVSIIKPSGNTLLFNCNCNTGINEEEEEEVDDGNEQYDLLRFESVQVFNPDKENKETVYAAETENMDGELYSLLMNTLLERGITGNFVNDLIDLSTSLEHGHYVTFLKSLGGFVKER